MLKNINIFPSVCFLSFKRHFRLKVYEKFNNENFGYIINKLNITNHKKRGYWHFKILVYIMQSTILQHAAEDGAKGGWMTGRFCKDTICTVRECKSNICQGWIEKLVFYTLLLRTVMSWSGILLWHRKKPKDSNSYSTEQNLRFL